MGNGTEEYPFNSLISLLADFPLSCWLDGVSIDKVTCSSNVGLTITKLLISPYFSKFQVRKFWTDSYVKCTWRYSVCFFGHWFFFTLLLWGVSILNFNLLSLPTRIRRIFTHEEVSKFLSFFAEQKKSISWHKTLR